jgi:membrane-associated HD superfamily phosphohydrolase
MKKYIGVVVVEDDFHTKYEEYYTIELNSKEEYEKKRKEYNKDWEDHFSKKKELIDNFNKNNKFDYKKIQKILEPVELNRQKLSVKWKGFERYDELYEFLTEFWNHLKNKENK